MSSRSLNRSKHLLRSSGYMSFSPASQITEAERKCLEVQSPEELARSKYDLPVEFHPKIFEKWLHKEPTKRHSSRRRIHTIKLKKPGAFEKYILSQKTSIMFLCQSAKPARASKFEFLKANVLLNALEARPRFFAYRQMAIELLRNKMLMKIKIIGDNETCPSIAHVPHRVFSWSAEDYYKRRAQNHMVWLEVYERNFRDCLEMHKFKFDLEELSHFLNLIMCGAMCENENFSFETEVIQPLEDASDLLSVFERLRCELEENREACAELKDEHNAVNSRACQMEENVRSNIVQQIADASVLYPIMYRYQKAWYIAQADQVEIKNEKDLNEKRQEIDKWIHKIQEETSAMQNTLNMYYTEIEYYKTRINELTAKFETEYEDLENAVNYKKLSMNKNEVQRKFCTEQMEIYQEELNVRRAKKLMEMEERKRKAHEAAEHHLMKLVKSDAKKKKKEEKAKGGKAKNKKK